jgi:hypothetical protein
MMGVSRLSTSTFPLEVCAPEGVRPKGFEPPTF